MRRTEKNSMVFRRDLPWTSSRYEAHIT